MVDTARRKMLLLPLAGTLTGTLTVALAATLTGCSVLGVPGLAQLATPAVDMPVLPKINDQAVNALAASSAAWVLTVPQHGIPTLVPAQFSAEQNQVTVQTTASPNLAWWRAFDPQGQGLLSNLQALLLQHNAGFLTALDAMQLARSTLHLAEQSFWPTMSLALGSQLGSQQGVAPQRTGTTSLSSSWDLDFLGLQAQRISGSQLEFKMSTNEHVVLRRALQATLNQAYFQWLLVQQQVRYFEQAFPLQEELQAMNEAKYVERIMSLQELLSSRVQFQNLKLQSQTLAQQAKQADAALAVLLGQSPAVFKPKLPEVGVDGAYELPLMPQLPQQLPASVIQNRPDIENAAMRVRLAHMNVGTTRLQWFPFNLQLSANRGAARLNIIDLLQAGATHGWSLALGASLALLDGGARKHAQLSAQLSAEQSKRAYLQAVLQAVQEVEEGLSQLEQLQKQLDVQKESLSLARKTYEIAQVQFNERYLSKAAWLSAQLNYGTVEQQLFTVRIQQLQTMNQVMKNVVDWTGGS